MNYGMVVATLFLLAMLVVAFFFGRHRSTTS